MPVPALPPLAEWESFYVIVGSSAAALTGLMFVVIALNSEARTEAGPTALRAFATPIIVHFGAVLLISALLSTPEVAPQIVQIVIGSIFKGLLTGVLIGVFSQKVHSLVLGIVFGLAVGAFLAFLVAFLNYVGEGKVYFWQIMLPGALLGIIVGYATQKYGSRPRRVS